MKKILLKLFSTSAQVSAEIYAEQIESEVTDKHESGCKIGQYLKHFLESMDYDDTDENIKFIDFFNHIYLSKCKVVTSELKIKNQAPSY